MVVEIETRSDCARCAALCCIAFPAEGGEGFATTKRTGEPCPRLGPKGHCTIYDRRREEGFGGCIGFECFGAGQFVTSFHGGSSDWQADADRLTRMVGHFLEIRRAFELLWLARHAQGKASSMEARTKAQGIEQDLLGIVLVHDGLGIVPHLTEIEQQLRSLMKNLAAQD